MSKRIKIIFTYFKNNYQEIKDEEENIINIFRNYALLIKEKFEDLIFLYQGKKLAANNVLKLKNFKKRIIKFLVINMKLKIETINEPKQIICPKCQNLSLFILNEDKISFNNCIKRDNISLEIPKFIKSQRIHEEKIICDECFNNKSFYKMKFYKCFCNKNICPLCIRKHSKYKHNNKENNIEYYETFYKCHIHNNLYISYCKECHKNLCSECEENCKNHTIINFKKIKQGEKKINLIKNEINEGKEKIKHYLKNLEKLKIILDKKIEHLIENLNCFYKALEKINYCFESLFNYENIQSLAYFDSPKLLKYINYNLKEKIKKKLRIQIDLFDKPNRIEMVYENNKAQNSRTLLFGEEFFKNNKKNCILLINDEIKDFNNYYIFDSKKENSIKVELFEENKITNMSSLFNNCNSLTSVDISDWNMEKIINISQMFKSCQFLSTIKSSTKWRLDNIKNDISYIFFECSKLKEIPDISNWNTKNIINMSYIFKGCSELKSLPDISKWDTRNVVNMSNIFSGCKSLFSLPDISKWDISNVTDLSGIFSECKELKNIPDISNWNTSNFININKFFNNCSSLITIPDISKWDISNVKDISYLFSDCSSLVSLPDISIWNTKNVLNMKYVFNNCCRLSKLPNLSKWDTKNVYNMKFMFANCCSLNELSDISKWDISNVKDMDDMFSDCSSLKSLPDISQWNTSNIKIMSDMFNNCSSLISIPDISKWDIKNVTLMNNMFSNCINLEAIPDLRNWDTSHVEDITGIFYNCPKVPKHLLSKIMLKKSIY